MRPFPRPLRRFLRYFIFKVVDIILTAVIVLGATAGIALIWQATPETIKAEVSVRVSIPGLTELNETIKLLREWAEIEVDKARVP